MVVFYDQYGNELQREALKYGTVPSYNSWLPEGFERWVYKNSKRDVGSFKAITGNTYFLAVCNNSSSSSGEGGSSTPDTPSGPNYFYFKNIGTTETSFKLECDNFPDETVELEYSNDKTNWNDITVGINIPISIGETIYIKAKTENQYMCDSSYNYYYFSSNETSGDLEVGGSIMTLLDPTDTLRDISDSENCFCLLLSDMPNLKKADNLVCPAMILSPSCYSSMFCNDANLESINVNLLPAIDLTNCDYCYDSMFSGCFSLANVPNLPANALSDCCYCNMFDMASGSNTALTSVPVNLLPAATLKNGCYSRMFCNCEGLVNAPNLPSETLVDSCYYNMFYGCSSLNNVSAGFSSFNPTTATTSWLSGVSANGTFSYPGPTIDRGPSTVPNGWTITSY